MSPDQVVFPSDYSDVDAISKSVRAIRQSTPRLFAMCVPRDMRDRAKSGVRLISRVFDGFDSLQTTTIFVSGVLIGSAI